MFILRYSFSAVIVFFGVFIFSQNAIALIRKTNKVYTETPRQNQQLTRLVLLTLGTLVALALGLYASISIDASRTNLSTLLFGIVDVVAIALGLLYTRASKETQARLPEWLRAWMID